MFATGRHPSYPGVYMDGRDGVTDVRLEQPDSTGAYIRCGEHPSSHRPIACVAPLGFSEYLGVSVACSSTLAFCLRAVAPAWRPPRYGLLDWSGLLCVGRSSARRCGR